MVHPLASSALCVCVLLLAVALGVVLASPAAAQFDGDADPPATAPSQVAAVDSDLGMRLIVPGVALVVIGYLANAIVVPATAFITGGGADAGLYVATAFIPIAGPFVSAGLMTEERLVAFVPHLVAGAVELVGLALCIAGAAIELTRPHPRESDAFFALEWTLTPWVGDQAAGASFRLDSF